MVSAPLARHFAKRELRPAPRGDEEDEGRRAGQAADTDGAAATTTTTAAAKAAERKKTKGTGQQQRRRTFQAQGQAEEGGDVEKMLTRLTCKLQEKRKSFAFGFALEAEDGAGNGRDARPVEEIARELEAMNLGKKDKAAQKNKEAKLKRKLKKQQQQQQQQQDGKENQAEDDEISPPTPSSSSSSSSKRADQAYSQPGPTADTTTSSATPPPPKLPPPPGLPPPSSHDDTKQKKKKKKHKGSSKPPSLLDVAVLHLDSWKAADLTEEEKLRKRFGQGTRNLAAIARREEKKGGLGVIGSFSAGAQVSSSGSTASAGAVATTQDGLTNAFSFGFAL